ncbi:MAG: ATP-binding cassette domain-containing protein, partial [Candidatus Limnocylindria bacterium]
SLVHESLTRVLAGGERTMVLVEHRVADAVDLVDRVIVLDGEAGVVADGTPAEVFARRGDQLAAAGVWVPGHPLPRATARRSREPGVRLSATAVGYTFPGDPRPAVGPIDLEVRSSEALAIVGPNGSGKSTLALLLGGLLKPTVGSVTSPEGEALWRWPARRLAARVGSVFQDPEHQFVTGRVRDELEVAPAPGGASAADLHRRAGELLERLHLSALAEANPFTLSGGEKRRLSVATALVREPEVLILDEPTFGQDRRTSSELLELLAGQRDDGAAVCFVTHDLAFAGALADRTLELGR